MEGCEKESIFSPLIYVGVIIIHSKGRIRQNINILLCMSISVFLLCTLSPLETSVCHHFLSLVFLWDAMISS